MPLKQSTTQPSEKLTYAAAKSLFDQLQALGIPVSNLREQEDGSLTVVSTSDPNWFDDGQPHLYLATIWGSDAELGLVAQQLKANGKVGGFQNILDLAEGQNESVNPLQTYDNAIQAVLGLQDFYTYLDSKLALKF